MEEMQQHQGEWFFLHELNVDKVFSTIQRADYLILYYIKVEQEEHPGEKLYLADLAAAMGLRVTELSKGIEKLQDSGFVTWKTDREAGRTYVELSSKAVELMAEEQALLQRCYRRMRAELGDAELRRAAAIMQRATAILKEEREKEFPAAPCVLHVAHHLYTGYLHQRDEPVGPLQKVRLPHLSVLQVHRLLCPIIAHKDTFGKDILSIHPLIRYKCLRFFLTPDQNCVILARN